MKYLLKNHSVPAEENEYIEVFILIAFDFSIFIDLIVTGLVLQ